MSTLKENELISAGTLPPDDFSDCIERTVEVARFELLPPDELAEHIEGIASDLLVSEGCIRECVAALQVGHLVLQGPPGTGKSTLARRLAEVFNAEYLYSTAHEGWTSYDVIGRHELRREHGEAEKLVPVNGYFTEAAIRCAGAYVRHADNPAMPQAAWLLIDELNRAHPDRAFGELFSVLGTDDAAPVTLSHQPAGQRLLYTPRRFRLVATMNSTDKQYVNGLSHALRRRLTFVNVDVPPPRSPGQHWTTDKGLAGQEFARVPAWAAGRVVRKLKDSGGAIVDVARLNSILAQDPKKAYEELFGFVELVRYSPDASTYPHLPIGTAALIDTLELAFSLLLQSGDEVTQVERFAQALDVATALKIVPLFEGGEIGRTQLRSLASMLPSASWTRTRQAIGRVAADGMYFV